MRNTARAVIIQDNHIILIKRVRQGETYYVFPGGGTEEGETPERTAIREAFEELGITIQVTGLLARINYDGEQFFFAADIVEGIIGTGTGEEFTDPDRNRGIYEPLWIPVGKLSSLDLRPKEMKPVLMTKWS